MKKVLLFLICCIMSLGLYAQRISMEDAKGFAESFFNTKATRGTTAEVELAYIAESQDNVGLADFYVFNNKTGGFVLVAADERASDTLIGYSTEGAFNYENIPSNMKWWLGEYVRQMDYLRANVKPVKMRSKSLKATATEVIVAPLLGNTKWDQGEPYNRYSPKFGGGSAPTGCVATAMAQIMYYHKWPKVGKGSHTNANYKDMTVDFSQSVYQWDKMLDTYTTGNYNATQADAVAKLMYDCGVSVDMEYTIDGSGALSKNVYKAFQTYFDYSDDVTYINRDEFVGDWDKLIISELESFRPVLYCGYDLKEGGHAFVCDGYEKKDGEILLHVNWGWGGANDGYFKSSIMNMNNSMSFKFDQDITYKIYANNKVKCGSLYYNTLLEGDVQVACPDTRGEYTGDIVIPSTITLDGKTYNVTGINSSAFAGCENITSIEIPSSVTQLGGNAFSGCTGLKKLVLHWTDPLELPIGTFTHEFWAGVTVVVPDGCVDKYANTIPWMFFGTIKDNSGNKAERSPWEKFESGKGIYHYSVIFGTTKSECEIIGSYRIGEENEYNLILKNWGDGTDVVLTYNEETKQCMIPMQSIGVYNYTVLDHGEERQCVGDIYIADMPNYCKFVGADPGVYSYDKFPCTYDPITGVFEFVLEYFTSMGSSFGDGKETFVMQGEQYKDMSVSIEAKSDLVEADDMTASQRVNLTGGKDVAQFKYSVLEGWMNKDKRKETALKIADGTIESKVKDNTARNLVIVSYPKPGRYTLMAVSVDADGNSYGHFDYMEVEFISSKQFEEVTTGTYTYYYFFANDDGTPYNDEGLALSRNIDNPDVWKISNVFYDVDFIFQWDQEVDTVTFNAQKIGYTYPSYGDVWVANNTDYFIPKSDYYCGKPSYFDRATETFYFNNVYFVDAGFFSDLIGTETFHAEGLATAIRNIPAIQKKTDINTGKFNLSGQKVDDSYKGIIITDGKKYLKK